MIHEDHIATFYYNKRLRTIENGMPVRHIKIYHNTDFNFAPGIDAEYFSIYGDNASKDYSVLDKIEDIIDEFGKPAVIEKGKNYCEFEFLNIDDFIDPEYSDITFRERQIIKDGIELKRSEF